VSGRISFEEFLDRYGTFYMTYALDGHESGLGEKALLEVHRDRIVPHREIWERIIGGGLCSDEDARKESYIQAGRFGSGEGLRRLRESATASNNGMHPTADTLLVMFRQGCGAAGDAGR
jgi:hypothetical protein